MSDSFCPSFCQYELLSDWHSWGVLTSHIFQTSDIADRLRQDLCVWFHENKPFKTKTLPLYIMLFMIHNTQKTVREKDKGEKIYISPCSFDSVPSSSW